MTIEFQITMNGEVKGFPSIKEVTDYLLKNWNDDTFYSSIRKIKIGDNCTGFKLQREAPQNGQFTP